MNVGPGSYCLVPKANSINARPCPTVLVSFYAKNMHATSLFLQKNTIKPIGDNGVMYVGQSIVYEVGLSPQRKSRAFLDKVGIQLDFMSSQELKLHRENTHKTLSSPVSGQSSKCSLFMVYSGVTSKKFMAAFKESSKSRIYGCSTTETLASKKNLTNRTHETNGALGQRDESRSRRFRP